MKRQDEAWEMAMYAQREESVQLRSIGIELSLADLYSAIALEDDSVAEA